MCSERARRALLTGLATLLLAGCGGPAAPAEFSAETALHPHFSGEQALRWAARLVELGPRPSGSQALEETRRLLEAELRELGWETQRQTFSDRTPRGPQTFVNLRARFSGEDTWERPVRAVVGSHYDTKFFAASEFVGANDGASGNALMLELARIFARQPELARRMELVFFDGEEAWRSYAPDDGLHGSRFYAGWLRKLPAASRPRVGIIFDMVGDPDLRIGFPTNSSPRLQALAMQAAESLGTAEHFGRHPGEILDDHVPLAQAGLEVLNFIDLDFPAWHTPRDTMEQVSAESLEVVGRAGILLLEKNLLREPPP